MAAIQGKWYASANGHDAYPADPDTVRFVYADQPNGERYIVAKVWADGEDYESNARLVAAAPAMLGTLRAVSKDISNSIFSGGKCTLPEKAFHQMLHTINAVISFAEGRSE